MKADMERAQADLFEAQKRIRNLEQQLRELQQVRGVVVLCQPLAIDY